MPLPYSYFCHLRSLWILRVRLGSNINHYYPHFQSIPRLPGRRDMNQSRMVVQVLKNSLTIWYPVHLPFDCRHQARPPVRHSACHERYMNRRVVSSGHARCWTQTMLQSYQNLHRRLLLGRINPRKQLGEPDSLLDSRFQSGICKWQSFAPRFKPSWRFVWSLL